MKGFTLVELLIVIAITFILAVSAVPIYGSLQVQAQLNESTSQIVQTLRSARQMSVSGYNNSQHGVYFDVTAGNDKYILYQGSDYSARDNSYDRETILDGSLPLSFIDLSLTGDDVDINFTKNKGKASNTGTVTLTHDVSGQRQIIINSLGVVEEN